jgi:hypothetical protein
MVLFGGCVEQCRLDATHVDQHCCAVLDQGQKTVCKYSRI